MTQQSSQIIYSKTVQGKRYIVPRFFSFLYFIDFISISFFFFNSFQFFQFFNFISKNPVSLNPQVLLQTRETNIQNRIKYRIQELENLPSNIPQNLKIKALIELKALRLLEFQTKVFILFIHFIHFIFLFFSPLIFKI